MRETGTSLVAEIFDGYMMVMVVVVVMMVMVVVVVVMVVVMVVMVVMVMVVVVVVMVVVWVVLVVVVVVVVMLVVVVVVMVVVNTVLTNLRLRAAQWQSNGKKGEQNNACDVGKRQIKSASLTIRPSYPQGNGQEAGEGGVIYLGCSRDEDRSSYTILGNRIPVTQSAANQITSLTL